MLAVSARLWRLHPWTASVPWFETIRLLKRHARLGMPSRYVTSDRDCTVPSICALRPEGFLIVYVHVRGGVLVFEEVVCFFYYYLPVVRVEYS